MPLTTHGFPYLDGSEVAGTGIPDNSEDLADKIESEIYPAFTDVAFNGAWANFGAPYEEASYARIGIKVWLRGLIKHAVTTTTGTVFTLPVGYRPAKTRRFVIDAGSGQAIVTLSNAGVFSIASYINGGSATTIGLDKVSWDVAA